MLLLVFIFIELGLNILLLYLTVLPSLQDSRGPCLVCPSFAGFVLPSPDIPGDFLQPRLKAPPPPSSFLLFPHVLEPILLNFLIKNHSILELEEIWTIILMYTSFFFYRWEI